MGEIEDAEDVLAELRRSDGAVAVRFSNDAGATPVSGIVGPPEVSDGRQETSSAREENTGTSFELIIGPDVGSLGLVFRGHCVCAVVSGSWADLAGLKVGDFLFSLNSMRLVGDVSASCILCSALFVKHRPLRATFVRFRGPHGKKCPETSEECYFPDNREHPRCPLRKAETQGKFVRQWDARHLKLESAERRIGQSNENTTGITWSTNVVAKVDPDSWASRQGIKPGWVLANVDGESFSWQLISDVVEVALAKVRPLNLCFWNRPTTISPHRPPRTNGFWRNRPDVSPKTNLSRTFLAE